MVSGDDQLDTRALELLRAFGSPVSMVWAYFNEPRTATGSAHRHGLVYLATEAGGTGSLSPTGVRICDHGVIRTLSHVGVLKNTGKFPVIAAPETRLTELAGRDYYVYAPDAGLFEWYCALGDEVEEGQVAGMLHFNDNPARVPMEVVFRHGGLFICKRHFARCERGDCLAHLATDFRGLS